MTDSTNTKKLLLLGANAASQQVHLHAAMGNRHGLVTGATGTGKTVSLQILAEAFSRIGVPVFTADVKGDLSGMAVAAAAHPKIEERIKKIGIDDYQARAYPLRFWDIYGKSGHLVRATLEDIGPDLLANLLDLSEAQASVLFIAFTCAEDEKLPLLDTKDLRSLLNFLRDNKEQLQAKYGDMSTRSIGALQRKLLVLEKQGGEQFFGEPALDIKDFMQQQDGYGIINVFDGRDLILNPRVYTTFLLWFLTELFEQLEEQGDTDKPRFVFFFDEAHLLFDNAPKALLDRVEQVVRIIRSKGVGIYFVTQSPGDIPDAVLAQLGNRIQHGLRAYTVNERKAVKAAADSFRANPAFDTQEKITTLGVGEALVSVLDDKGIPTIVEQTLIVPPQSKIGPALDGVREEVLKNSALKSRYDQLVDRESAYEILEQRRVEKTEQIEKLPEEEKVLTSRNRDKPSGYKRQGYVESFVKTLLRSLATGMSRRVLNTLLRSLKK